MQALHDYLAGTGLIPEESMQIYIPEGEVFGLNDAAYAVHYMTDEHQVNIEISDYPFVKLDFRYIKMALLWWLNVYQTQPKKGTPYFKYLYDLETSSTAYIWIGLKLTEESKLENGEISSCLEPLVDPIEALPQALSIYLEQQGIDAEELISSRE